MDIETRSTTLETGAGRMPIHVARPKGAGGKLPAVIVIMEAFGLNEHIKDVTNRFAREGYHAVAPDVYYRQGSRVVRYDQLQQAIGMLAALKDDEVVADLKAVVSALESDGAVRGDRIGITGFCMGGRISYLAACETPDIRASVPWYGGSIAGQQMQPGATAPAERTAKLKGAMLLHFGGKDAFIPPQVVEEVRKALEREKKDFELHVYADADHGFYCDERPSYHPEAAKLAWKRTLDFFQKHLKA
ncbi:MAG: dienelactone hydrolase family protein [Candidatus Binatia bacterium]